MSTNISNIRNRGDKVEINLICKTLNSQRFITAT